MVFIVTATRRFIALILVLLPLLTIASFSAAGAKYHPKKALFADISAWPITTPNDVRLENFRPFRAVYDREYRQASGPDAGATRRDRVIVIAESVAWNGIDAITISLIDSGDTARADTNSRVLNMTVSNPDLRLIFEVGPVPGTAKNYYVRRVFDDRVSVNMIDTQTSKVTRQDKPISGDGFGPGNWVLASLASEPGRKILLHPYHSPTSNPLSSTSYAVVSGTREVLDSAGISYTARVLETSGNFSMSSPKMSQILVLDSPPYYLGTVTRNLDSGELRPFITLRSFQYLDTT